jgi:Trpc4-associated protein
MEGSGNASDCRFQHAAVFFPTSKFFSWFLHLRRRVCYLALLVSSISVDTLTLENVSCLNTALIILMLAARQGTLASCLKMLATATIEQLKLGILYISFNLKTYIIIRYNCCLISAPGSDERVGLKRCLEPRHILSSLFQLLRFWRVHYQPGDQSCISLEKGSGIAFEEWIRTIDLLTSSDTSSPYSLLHYLTEDQSQIVQSWDIDIDLEGS